MALLQTYELIVYMSINFLDQIHPTQIPELAEAGILLRCCLQMRIILGKSLTISIKLFPDSRLGISITRRACPKVKSILNKRYGVSDLHIKISGPV